MDGRRRGSRRERVQGQEETTCGIEDDAGVRGWQAAWLPMAGEGKHFDHLGAATPMAMVTLATVLSNNHYGLGKNVVRPYT